MKSTRRFETWRGEIRQRRSQWHACAAKKKESPQIYRAVIALRTNLKCRTIGAVAALEFRPHVAARPLDLLQTFEPFEGTVVASSSTLRRPLRRTADRNCGSAIERIAEMTNWRRSYRRDLASFVDRLSIALDQPPKAKRADLQNSVVGPLGQSCRYPAQHWYDLSNRLFPRYNLSVPS